MKSFSMKFFFAINIFSLLASTALVLLGIEFEYEVLSKIKAYFILKNNALERYQTLLTGLIAIGAALCSLHGIKKQISHDKFQIKLSKYETKFKASREIEISITNFLGNFVAVIEYIKDHSNLAQHKRETIVKQGLAPIPYFYQNALYYSILDPEDLIVINALEKNLAYCIMMARHLENNPLASIDVNLVHTNAVKCLERVIVLYMGLFHRRTSPPQENI